MNMRWLHCSLLLLLTASQAHAAASPKGDPVHGKQIFTAQTCGMCHVNGGNMICPDKPLKGIGFEKKYPKDSMIADVIRRGVQGTSMDSFGKDKLPDSDLKDVIAYIRSLTPASPAQSTATKSEAAHKGGNTTQSKQSAASKQSAESKQSTGLKNARQAVPPSKPVSSDSKKMPSSSKPSHK